jgi:hypothetical protein
VMGVFLRPCLNILDENIVRGGFCGIEGVFADAFLISVLKKQNALFYRSFGPFSGEENPGEREVANIELLIAAGKWYEARESSAQLIQASLAGLRYLQTCVSFSFPTLPDPFSSRFLGTTRHSSE